MTPKRLCDACGHTAADHNRPEAPVTDGPADGHCTWPPCRCPGYAEPFAEAPTA